MNANPNAFKVRFATVVTLLIILACNFNFNGNGETPKPEGEPTEIACPYEDPMGGCAEWQGQSCQASVAVIQVEVSMDIWDQVFNLSAGSEYILLEDTRLRLWGDGRADIDYGDGHKITLYAPAEGDTVLDVETWNGTRSVVVSAGSGQVIEQGADAGCTTTVLAATEEGVVEIASREGEFFVAVSPGAAEKQVQIAVSSGEIEVRDIQGNVMTLSSDPSQLTAALFFTAGQAGDVLALDVDSAQLSQYLSLGLDLLGQPIIVPDPVPQPIETPGESVIITPTPTVTAVPKSEPSGRIVYTCFDNVYDNICTINPDGSDQQQLTFADATDFYASWSPDGGQIIFSSRRDGSFQLYTMADDGENENRLSFELGTGGLFAPAYSPDGSQIAFTRAGGGEQNIWVMDSDGSDPEQLTFDTNNVDPVWSPDGSQIAFSSTLASERGIHIMDKSGANVIHLETGVVDMGGRLDWSPDGRWIAFYAGEDGKRQIYLIEVGGGELVQLTFEGDNLAPSFSLDGLWVAYTSYIDGDNEIFIIRVDGTDRRQVTHNNRSDWQPRWGP